GVLANDTDIDGKPLTTALVTGTAHGALTLRPDGSFTYTPVAGYIGPDRFTYQAGDGTNTSNVATVTLSVNPAIPTPVSRDDAYTTMQNRPLRVIAPGVLVNDLTPGIVPTVVVLVSGPSHGTLTLRPDGSFTYTPAANVTGSDAFTYRVSAGS